MTQTTVRINGIIGGRIWMPATVCGKRFNVSRNEYPFNAYSDGSKAGLRDMILHVTNDGDFQGASVADATVTFERISTRDNGEVFIRRRHMDIRQFPSVVDCVLELESEKYWEVVDCFAEVE